MEAVKKAASGAVETIRNSPLFRRKFGTYQKASSNDQDEQERPISPEKDRTPFVQGIYFQVSGGCEQGNSVGAPEGDLVSTAKKGRVGATPLGRG